MIRISVWAAIFLVLLRIGIGWHFFFEGYGKVRSANLGKAAVNEKPFSSESYFRESEGPFGKFIKSSCRTRPGGNRQAHCGQWGRARPPLSLFPPRRKGGTTASTASLLNSAR